MPAPGRIGGKARDSAHIPPYVCAFPRIGARRGGRQASAGPGRGGARAAASAGGAGVDAWIQADPRGGGRPPGGHFRSPPGTPDFFLKTGAEAKGGVGWGAGMPHAGARRGAGCVFHRRPRAPAVRAPVCASWAAVVQPACAATTGCGTVPTTDDLGVRTLGKKSPVLEDLFNAGIEHGPQGARGRDPRVLGAAELAKLGHHPTTPLRALRATCMAHLGTAPKVRACAATECPAWAFRLGKHPWLKKIESTPEQKRAAAARAGAARIALAKKRAEPKKIRPQGVNKQRGGPGAAGGRRG